MELTLPQLEDLTKGIMGDQSGSSSHSTKRIIEGSAALAFLQQGNGKL